MKPLVSIVIPAFNAADYLPATLASIRSQLLRGIETIIVDDGSTDDTAAVVEGMQDPDLRLIRLEHSGGPARPRNAGIRSAAGRYIALFDSDDIMRPEKLTDAVRVLEEVPDADFVCTDFDQIDERGAVVKERCLMEYRMFRRALVPTAVAGAYLIRPERLYPELLRANFIATSSVVLRQHLVEQVGGFDESLVNADDIDLWLRLARAGKRLVFIEAPGHQYRRRRNSISAGGGRRFPSVLRVLEKQRRQLLTVEERKLLAERIWLNQTSYAWWLKRGGAYRESFRLYRKSLRVRITSRNLRGFLHAGACLLGGRGGGDVGRAAR